MQIPHFKVYSKQDILSLIKLRRFETKLGERVEVVHSSTGMAAYIAGLSAKYIVIGIPEDIGV